MQSTVRTAVASFRGLLRRSRARRVEIRKRCSSLLFLLLLIFSAACTPASHVTVAREMPTGFEPGEAIGFLFSRQFSLHGVRIEESEIIGCISEAVRKAHPALRIVSPDEFRRVVFPDLPPEGAPNELEYLVMLLEHPTFKGRVTSLSIRYLIFVSGATEEQLLTGRGQFMGVPGPGVILGAEQSWLRNSQFAASILDLKHHRTAGKVGATASGVAELDMMIILFPPIPIPIPVFGKPAPTESTACEELGDAVAKFIAGEAAARPEGNTE